MINTRLEIGGKDYAIVTDIPISTDYTIADIREPDKRNATQTKTIVLYGTNDLNILFENIFEANIVTQSFNPNLKIEAKYFVDEQQVLNGNLQLLKITLTPDGNIVYECNILGNEGNLFVDIGEKYITGNPDSSDDLDFSAYDHNYTRANQIASWSNAGTGLSYYYGFIHRGLNGGSDSVFNVSDFIPQFFAREYFDKILTKHGYTFTSDILDSAEFSNYVVEPNINAIALSTAQLNNMQLNVGLTADVTLTDNVLSYISYNDESTPFFDVGTQHSGGIVTLNETSRYNIVGNCFFKLSFTHSDGTVNSAVDVANATYFTAFLFRSVDGGTTYTVVNTATVYPITIQTNNAINKATDYFVNVQVNSGDQLFNSSDKFKIGIRFKSQNITYKTGSNGTGSIVTTGTATWTPTLLSGDTKSSFYTVVTDKVATEGNPLYCNNALPQKIKQKDFIKSIMQALNLYIDVPDKNNPKDLVIETYTDYYDNGTYPNELLIDSDKEISVNPISLVDGKKYIFTYKDDSDFYNAKYKTDWSENFGTEIIDIENDFIKAEKKNELIFSATPNVANYSLGISMPKIFKNENGIIKPSTPNIRLLYARGLSNTVNPYTYKQIGLTDLVTTEYGAIGHTDDDQTPTIDLNFGTPKEVYYNFVNSQFTTNNLYNRFHRPFILNTTSRDSKVLVCNLWLTPTFMRDFSFRKRYFIKDAYYIFNKIVGYNPMVSQSTKCELIKVLDLELFTPTQTYFRNSNTIKAGSDITLPTVNGSLNRGTSINLGTNCLSIGDGNFIPASCSNVTVIGNNIIVDENISNSSVINTNDYSLLSSDTSVVGGVVVSSFNNDVVETFTTSKELSTTDATTINVECSSANLTMYLPDVRDCFVNGISKIYNIKKIDATAYTVIVTSTISDLIDGEVEQIITAQYDSISLYTDGTNWFIK